MSERHKYKPVAVRDTFEELTEDDLNVLSIGGRTGAFSGSLDS